MLYPKGSFTLDWNGKDRKVYVSCRRHQEITEGYERKKFLDTKAINLLFFDIELEFDPMLKHLIVAIHILVIHMYVIY